MRTFIIIMSAGLLSGAITAAFKLSALHEIVIGIPIGIVAGYLSAKMDISDMDR